MIKGAVFHDEDYYGFDRALDFAVAFVQIVKVEGLG